MGIKGLSSAIKKSSCAVSEKPLIAYSGSTIAIDSEILVYKYKAYSNKQTDYDPNIYHLYAFLNNAISYLKNNIIPIYIFDGGKIPKTKQENCLAKRYEIKEKTRIRINDLENKFLEKCAEKSQDILNDDKINKYLASSETLDLLDQLLKVHNNNPVITKEYRASCKYFLKLLGLPVIVSNGEAEVVCVKLVKNKLADYVFTEDSDSIVYGLSIDRSIDRDVSILKKSENGSDILEISSKKVLESLGLHSVDEFVDYCILSGCDYCPTIPRIGPITALKIIKEYKSIEKYITEKSLDSKVLEEFKYVEARNVFFNPQVSIDDIGSLTVKEPDLINLKKFLEVEKKINSNSIIFKWSKAIEEYKKITGLVLEKPFQMLELSMFEQTLEPMLEPMLEPIKEIDDKNIENSKDLEIKELKVKVKEKYKYKNQNQNQNQKHISLKKIKYKTNYVTIDMFRL